jgi:ribosomal protein S18 acetylase RimI-like enzyme
MIVIRKLTPTDLPELAALYQELMDEPTDGAAMAATFEWMAANPDYLTLVAQLDGAVVGSLMGIVCRELVGRCRPFMVIENVIVAPDRRRIGVGRALMTEIEHLARERGCSIIEFCSSSHRKEAHRFYESLGYSLDVVQGFRKWLT